MYKHYIAIDKDNYVLRGFSTAFVRPTESDICINKKASRHFELFGMVNPPMRRHDRCPLYKWNGTQVVKVSKSELNKLHKQQQQNAPAPQETLLDQVIADNANLTTQVQEQSQVLDSLIVDVLGRDA